MIIQKVYLLYVVIIVNYLNIIKADDDDCEIVGLKWDSLNMLQKQNDTIDGEIISFKTVNIRKIFDNQNNYYITANFNEAKQELSISTSEAFKNYEETEIGDRINIIISCECVSNSIKKTTIGQPLIDVNTHPPKFSNDIFEYTLPMPWPKSIDITILKEIIVKDIDFSNRQIKFEIDENEYFEIISIGSIDKKYKQYPAVIRPKTHLHLEDNLSLEISATDEKDIYGTQYTEKATIKIIIDKNGSVPPVPRFEKLLYEGIYHDTDTIELENIIIVKETYVDTINIEVSGKYGDNFNIKQIENNKYQLDVVQPLPSSVWESEKQVSLTLKIKDEYTGTSVVLMLDENNLPTPRFEKFVYEGVYYDTNKIDLEDLIIVKETYVESIDIEISGKHSENFNIKHVKNNRYQLEVKETLPPSVWETEKHISLALKIIGENSGTSVVLALNGKELPTPRFEKFVYEGVYLDTNKIDLEDLIIVEETFVESIDIKINGKYSKNFDIKRVKENRYQLEVIEPLPSNVWETEKYVSLALEIKGEYSGTSVVLTLNGNKPPTPRFEKLVYEGVYQNSNKIDLEDLVIVEDTYVESIEIEVNGKYRENFNVLHVKDNIYQINVIEPLPSTVWESDKYITLELVIKKEYTGTTVVLTLGENNLSNSKFEKFLYEGVYHDTNKIDLEDLVLAADTHVESEDIEVNGKYSKNFNIKHVKDKNYQLEVTKPLPSSVWESEKYISLTLEIKGEYSGTSIILKLEGEKLVIPRFEKLVYEGIYHDTNEIDLEDLVIVEETYVESINIEISGKYKKYFNIKHVKDNRYELEVTEILPSSVWETEKYISLVLQIKEEYSGTSVVLTLNGNKPPTPKFEKLVYEGKYHDTNKIDLENLVIVEETYVESIDILISGKYSENFNVKHIENNKYQLEIKEDLPSSVWGTEKYVSLVLEIKNEKTGTTIVLTLVSEEEIPDACKLALTFLEPLEEFIIISTDFNGQLSSKRAIDFPESKIKYSAKDKPDFVEIDETTGNVTIKKDVYIQQGIYEFDIFAENKLKDKNSYKITLYVHHKSITSKNTLTVITIPENKSQTDLIHLDSIDKKQMCKFEIKNVFPKGAWFVINDKSGNIDVTAINRRDQLFDNMYLKEIQVQLILNINCLIESAETKFIELFNNSTYHKSFMQIFNPNDQLNNEQDIYSDMVESQHDHDDNKYEWIYTNEISHNTEQMIINIRIDNTENHPPQFIDVSPLNIGYPNIEVIEAIHPQFVYQVHAIDEDIGLNGEITYKLEPDDSLFLIHPKTGVIYPNKKASNWIESKKISLTAKAVDQNGEGISTDLPITVYILTFDQISIMKIDRGLIENLPSILEELSKQTEWSVQQLTSAVMPEIKSAESDELSQYIHELSRKLTGFLSTDNIDTSLTIYTYAFDKDNKIIGAKEFAEKINNMVFEDYDWSVDSVVPQSNNTISEIIIQKGQSKGLLIAVIIVGVAFVCYIIGSIFFMKNRNRKNQNLVYTTKPQINVQDDLSNTNPRLSVIINDNLIGSSNSDGDDIKQNTLRASHGMRERKKSMVTFNDEIEQIELKGPENPQTESIRM